MQKIPCDLYNVRTYLNIYNPQIYWNKKKLKTAGVLQSCVEFIQIKNDSFKLVLFVEMREHMIGSF